MEDYNIISTNQLLNPIPTREQVIEQYKEFAKKIAKINSWWKLKEFKKSNKDIPVRVIGSCKKFPYRGLIVTCRYKNLLASFEFSYNEVILHEAVSVFTNNGKTQFKYCRYDRFDPTIASVLKDEHKMEAFLHKMEGVSLPTNYTDLPF